MRIRKNPENNQEWMAYPTPQDPDVPVIVYVIIAGLILWFLWYGFGGFVVDLLLG